MSDRCNLMRPNFGRRSTQSEWMDTETVTADDFADCLNDLATVNTVTLARLPTLGFIARIARRHPSQVISVLDVGCGEGDMLRRLHCWSRRTGVALDLTGLDMNEQGNAAARAATPSDMNIHYRTADIFASDLGSYDVIISSLFTHHLTDPQVVDFLQVMERHTRLGWFVNDLHRNAVAYHGFRALSAAAGWHRFVRHDGPISVARSFRRPDWHQLLTRAGLANQAQVRWHVPFRYCVQRFK
jgi:2-polyprenyl-3-methyl-5-hydroxy-6-metoxy-1,4-benzoquinol methylase